MGGLVHRAAGSLAISSSPGLKALEVLRSLGFLLLGQTGTYGAATVNFFPRNQLKEMLLARNPRLNLVL